jgi:large subunit ribosomal protein L21
VYAIISDGGFQYRVQEGLIFEVQRRDLPEGTTSLGFDRVLMVGDLPDGPKIGCPTVPGAKVTASVMGELKGDKLIIQKFTRRKGYRLKKGHRQQYLQVRVEKIES